MKFPTLPYGMRATYFEFDNSLYNPGRIIAVCVGHTHITRFYWDGASVTFSKTETSLRFWEGNQTAEKASI